MAVDITELKQKRMFIVTEQRKKLDMIDARGSAETAEEKLEFEKQDADIDALTGRIDREERQICREADLARAYYEAQNTTKGEIVHDEARSAAGSTILSPAGATQAGKVDVFAAENRGLMNDALSGWLKSKHAEAELLPAEVLAARKLNLNLRGKELVLNLRRDYRNVQHENRDLSLTASAGGYTVPVGFSQAYDRALLAFGGVRQVARVVRTTSGSDLHWPTTNDTTNKGAILAEATTFSTSVDAVFAEVIFKAFKYSSKPMIVSNELLQDSFFDLPAMIGEMLGERIGRIQNDHFTTGAGTTLPKGLTVAGTAGTAAAATNTFTSDEVIGLQHNVDPAYRPQSTWMFHDTVLAFIRKLKESTTNAYIWQPGMQNGVPDMLLGQRYTINQSMATAFTTGQKLMLFGDMSKYVIRDVAEVRLVRLDELFAQTDQVGFVAFQRGDGNLLNAGTNPVKWMALA